MRILIICLQGLTSRVIARKLSAIAEEKGIRDEYKAIGYQDVSSYREWADIVLLTPQIRTFREAIGEAFSSSDTEIYQLSIFAESFNHVDRLYEEIQRLIRKDSVNPKSTLNRQELRNMAESVSVLLVFELIAGGLLMLALKLFRYTGSELPVMIKMAFWMIALIYTGYLYADIKNEKRKPFMLHSLATVIILILIFERSFVPKTEIHELAPILYSCFSTVPVWKLFFFFPLLLLSLMVFRQIAKTGAHIIKSLSGDVYVINSSFFRYAGAEFLSLLLLAVAVYVCALL